MQKIDKEYKATKVFSKLEYYNWGKTNIFQVKIILAVWWYASHSIKCATHKVLISIKMIFRDIL